MSRILEKQSLEVYCSPNCAHLSLITKTLPYWLIIGSQQCVKLLEQSEGRVCADYGPLTEKRQAASFLLLLRQLFTITEVH